MRKVRKAIVAGIGGAALIGVALFLGVHYRELLWPHAAQQQASNARPLNDSKGLNIPTIDEMCKAAGANSANMADCRDQENSAAEFVIAWMNLNGFIADGTIDLREIQLAASLADSEGNGLSNEPGLGANSDSPDSLAPDSDAEPSIDPATGLPVTEIFNSPAQIAMFCMSSSNDWLAMYECISRYDPSSHLDGN